jgi:hypothetical protein
MKNDCQANSAMQSAHIRVAKELGTESLVECCYAENGTEYERAIHDLLVFTKAFTVTVIDDGKRQNVPDLLVRLGKMEHAAHHTGQACVRREFQAGRPPLQPI